LCLKGPSPLTVNFDVPVSDTEKRRLRVYRKPKLLKNTAVFDTAVVSAEIAGFGTRPAVEVPVV